MERRKKKFTKSDIINRRINETARLKKKNVFVIGLQAVSRQLSDLYIYLYVFPSL